LSLEWKNDGVMGCTTLFIPLISQNTAQLVENLRFTQLE